MPAVPNEHDEEERREAERHDRLYREQRPADLTMKPLDWGRFDGMITPLCAYHASVLALGDLQGRQVLDMGCGDGWLSVILAKRGANVWGYDISPSAIETANARAAQNGVTHRTHFDVASAYQTPYPDRHFDLVIGQAILHHLGDKDRLALELTRVMRADATAVFSEPFAAVPWLTRVRKLVPVPSAAPDDPDQEQMTYADFEPFRQYFTVELEEYQLLSRLDRVLKAQGAIDWLGRVDRALLGNISFLRKYARTVVVTLRLRS
jgi:2-polyprenyl-3-methyl-5-hydroxy-6-metoxy-1,4-benzoquinol methylase